MVPDSWKAFDRDDDGFLESHSPMWDTRSYVDNSTINLPFFTSTGAGSTQDLTSNSFPLTEPFLLKALGVFFKIRPFTEDGGASAAAAAGQADDIAQLINTGWLEMGLAKEGLGPFPLWKLGAGGGLWGMLAAAGAEAANQIWDYTQIGTPNTDGLFKLQKPIILPPSTNLPCTMRWASAVNTATGNISICLYLDGVLAHR